jgi:DNA-binding GntR family transcriptional regulator
VIWWILVCYGDPVAELMAVDPYLPEPAYRQLAAILTRRIGAGEWPRGPLPSVNALQQDYGVGRDTVLHALRVLRDDGLIFTVPKRGSYVSQPR